MKDTKVTLLASFLWQEGEMGKSQSSSRPWGSFFHVPFLTIIVVVSVLIILTASRDSIPYNLMALTGITVPKKEDDSFFFFFTRQQPQEHHALPTLLSVVDPTSGSYLLASHHPLYPKIWNSTIVLRSSSSSSSLLSGQTVTQKQQPTLQLDKTKLNHARDSVTVSWKAVKQQVREDDLLALYCHDDDDNHNDNENHTTANPHTLLEVATISQAQATSYRHGGTSPYTWYIPEFPVTRYASCYFSLYQIMDNDEDRNDDDGNEQDRFVHIHDIQQYRLVATSSILDLSPLIHVPTQIHLALGSEPSTTSTTTATSTSTSIVVHFVTGGVGTPVAVYDTANPPTHHKAEGKSHTYTASQLCSSPANRTEIGHFQPPGQLHVIEMTNLQPNTNYYYKVGLATGQGIVWSQTVMEFTSPPVAADTDPDNDNDDKHSYVVYADQGCPSDGWGDGGIWTSAMMEREITAYQCRAIHHLGDLSYAKGAAHIWDEWMEMIEPFASRIPLMIAIGNHVCIRVCSLFQQCPAFFVFWFLAMDSCSKRPIDL